MRCQHRFRVQRPPPLPSPRFDGLAAQPFSVCSFRSPHSIPSLASPETELESGGTVGEEFGGLVVRRGLESRLRHPRAGRLRLPDVASRGLQVAQGAHECAYMPHRYFICTCKTITTQPGVSGDGGRWAGGRRGLSR